MTECTVDTILNKCDCLPFYYPESNMKAYSKKYRQCSLHDVKCLRDNRRKFILFSLMGIEHISHKYFN